MPATRSETALSTAATTRPTSAVKRDDSQKPQCQRVIAIADEVDADREVEGVPERQQSGVAEEQVVAERDPAKTRQSASSWSVPGEFSPYWKTYREIAPRAAGRGPAATRTARPGRAAASREAPRKAARPDEQDRAEQQHDTERSPRPDDA